MLEATGVEFSWDVQHAGTDVMDQHGGNPLPDHVLDSIRANGTGLKGPITTPVGGGFRSVNVGLRKSLGLYAQVRPCKSYPGVRSRYENVDLIVVRENTEDLYAGVEFEEGTEQADELLTWLADHGHANIRRDSGISIKPISETGTRQIVEFAFDYARRNGRRKVTAVHKANIMKFTDGLFLHVARDVAEVAKHQHPREHHRHRVHLVLPGVLRRGAVGRLEHGDVGAEVRAGREAEAADQASGEVGDDVAVEVRQHEHVVLLRPLHELHREVVDDPVLELDVGVLLRDVARDVKEEPVRELHDVRLVHGRDLAAAVAARVIEGELDDLPCARLGDRLDRDPGVAADVPVAARGEPVEQLVGVLGALLELDAGVQVLGVLAHDDEVDVLVARADARVGLA
ncbi:MAG TPA: isocitrate/isopropylmalate family dehydrogenase, partial [Gaiellaceae bacterium]|nr:isocitrate/isopropylmalate family dehydrogenase [Gaiellaceae bacterium]